MKKIFKSIFAWIAMFMGAKNELTDDAVNKELCDFSGQGRNKYGK